MRVCREKRLISPWAVRYFFLGGTLLFPERYAIGSWGVRCCSWAVRRSFLGGTLLFPGGYAIDEDPIAWSFMGGTLFVGRPTGSIFTEGTLFISGSVMRRVWLPHRTCGGR